MPVMTEEGAEASDLAEVENDAAVDGVVDSAGGDTGAADADETVPPEETVAPDEAAPVKPKRGLPNVKTLALAAVLAVLVVAVGVLGWQAWQQHQINQARDEALHAAVSYAEVLTSIDSNNVDENFRQVLDGATGEFKDMYSQSSGELRQLLIENKATAHGLVIDAAVQSVSKDKAVVLLFVDQSVSNTKLPDPRIDRSRMKMTLEKADGRWRASKVELP